MHNQRVARIHLFEFEDQPWFPATIRDAATAYLRFATRLAGQAEQLVPKLGDAVERGGTRRVVDLCSGGAGPIPTVVEALAENGVELSVTLTDRYPNLRYFELLSRSSEGRIDYVADSVDATDLPKSLTGLRTMFNALHHFRPDVARSILQSAVDDGQPIGVFEIVSRHPFVLVMMALVPIPVMLAVPFLRPLRWSWLLFTYVIPLIPLLVLWDGLVSCLRVYSQAELAEMVAGLEGGDRFDWEIGSIAMPPSPAAATYLIGTPRAGADVATGSGQEAQPALGR